MLELNRRLTNIDSQLRKSEVNRKHLEISNRKLLGFAQVREAPVRKCLPPVYQSQAHSHLNVAFV